MATQEYKMTSIIMHRCFGAFVSFARSEREEGEKTSIVCLEDMNHLRSDYPPC